jgi:hypothetical protein
MQDVSAAAPANPSPPPHVRIIDAFSAALTANADEFSAAFWHLVEALPKDGNNVVVEGDELLSTDELKDLLANLRQDSVNVAQQSAISQPLKVQTDWEGTPVYWKRKDQRTLTYAFDKQSFPEEAQYSTAVAAFESASHEWETLCSQCGITIQHKSALDTTQPAPSKALTFVVRFHDVHGKYIAASFFPFDPVPNRFVNVDPSYFRTRFDRVGVFRHELGHILGYRHEHIKGIAGCDSEDGDWKPLTQYDAHSVMHYFCGGGGTFALDFTDTDRTGHTSLYRDGKWLH